MTSKNRKPLPRKGCNYSGKPLDTALSKEKAYRGAFSSSIFRDTTKRKNPLKIRKISRRIFPQNVEG